MRLLYFILNIKILNKKFIKFNSKTFNLLDKKIRNKKICDV